MSGWGGLALLFEFGERVGFFRELEQVLPTDNMIDLVREHRRSLREATVLAGVVGAPSDKLPCLVRQRHDAARTAEKSSA